MSYCLTLKESLPESVRRVTEEQIGKAQSNLASIVDDPDETVHDIRKRFKKIRAVLRLVRDGIGKDWYQKENACFRDAGHILAPVRDSAVAITTLTDLRAHFADQLSSDVFEALEQRLHERHQKLFHQVVAREHGLEKVLAVVEEAHTRIPEWAFAVPDDFGVIKQGLKRVYARGRKAMTRAYAAPTPEHFHEWRKRVKYLWYHCRLLNLLWPKVLDSVQRTLHHTADYLGDAHDLAMLNTLLASHDDFFQDQTAREMLPALIRERRELLHAAARLPGERIYADKPKAVVKRMAVYCNARQYHAPNAVATASA